MTAVEFFIGIALRELDLSGARLIWGSAKQLGFWLARSHREGQLRKYYPIDVKLILAVTKPD